MGASAPWFWGHAMKFKENEIKALVFSGGGAKVPLHVGFLKAVLEIGLEPTKFYGNSAGSIIAACLASDMKYTDILDLVITTDFKDFVRPSLWGTLTGLFRKSYLVKGDRFFAFFQKVFQQRKMKDLENYLCVMGHSINKQRSVRIDPYTEPEMPIALACRISCSLPILFQPVLYKEGFLVDGGLSKDLPVDLCEEPYFAHLIQNKIPLQDWRNVSKLTMAEMILSNLSQSNCEESMRDNLNGKVIRTGYSKSIIDFNLSKTEKYQMIDSAYGMCLRVAKRYFQEQPHGLNRN